MAPVAPGSLVLVTGASGFIAAHTVKALLDAGFPVRGTVRSKDKGEYLADLFKGSKVPFEYVIVEDIGKPGAFDEAVKNVDAVAHTASPFHFKIEEPDELIRPAVDGTVGILDSIKKNNPDIKRVVVTSSSVAVASDDKPRPTIFTEKDWNEYSPGQVETKGRDSTPRDKYCTSKTLAERAFWKYLSDNKPAYDGVTINPVLVIGPSIHQMSDIKQLNTSNSMVLDWLTGNKTQADIPDFAPMNWVDVREVANAHVRALEVGDAAGERFLLSAGPAGPNEYCVVFEHLYPSCKTYPKGDASKTQEALKKSNVSDGSKATRVLGVKYRELEGSLKDTIGSLVKRFDLKL